MYFPTRDWAERVIVISYDIYNGPLKKKRKGGGGNRVNRPFDAIKQDTWADVATN